MTTVELARALLERLEQEASAPTTGGQPRATMGVQIDAEGLAQLTELAARFALPPALVLKLALRALEVELGKTVQQRGARLVGAERALLEGKR